jgi:hypothetical protein
VHIHGEMQEGVVPPAVGVRGLYPGEVFEILHVKTLHFGAPFYIKTKKKDEPGWCMVKLTLLDQQKFLSGCLT